MKQPVRSTIAQLSRWALAGRPTPAFLAVAAADIVLAATGSQRLRRVTKPLLMPTLMVNSDRPTQRALAIGGVGDLALLSGSPAAFTTGLAAFLLGHFAWIAALRGRPGRGFVGRHPVAAAPYLAGWAGLNAYLWSRAGRDRYAVAVYSSLLAVMALTALDTGRPVTAAGGALFLTSDAVLALERFGGVEFPASEGLVMATYAAAQALLAQ